MQTIEIWEKSKVPVLTSLTQLSSSIKLLTCQSFLITVIGPHIVAPHILTQGKMTAGIYSAVP